MPREPAGRSFELAQDLGYFHARYPITLILRGTGAFDSTLVVNAHCPTISDTSVCQNCAGAMPAKHTWTFKPRLRSRTFGWKGSHLACERLKEAVTEIKKVARVDPVTAADGVVCL